MFLTTTLSVLSKRLPAAANGANYEAVTYEGNGPNGVAVIVEALTDNRNRTAGEVRHYFDKFGGNMGYSGLRKLYVYKERRTCN